MADRRPLVYVAGPYTNPDPVLNTRKAIKVGMELWDRGFAPLIPHLTLTAHLVDPRPVETWYAMDLEHLRRCDALLRLPGASSGADMEVAFAHQQGIPVFWASPMPLGGLHFGGLEEWDG